YSRALLGMTFTPAATSRLLRPAKRNLAQLRRQCAQICRLAETNPKALAHPEVAHGLEQTLTYVLVNCLVAREAPATSPAGARRAAIMARFEELLSEHLDKPLRLACLCAELGAPERSLRDYCQQFLGLSPSRYLLLRRLKDTRIALRNADPAMASVTKIA